MQHVFIETVKGVITSEGIFINTQSKNPTRWAATHEFSHRMKQTGGKMWQRYQDYVISHLKETGKYEEKYNLKKGAYAENEIDEEIAADYIGEMFADVKELAEFIRESRQTAFSVRNMWYKVLDKLGLSDEKKKAQAMWAKAYREAMKNSDARYEDGAKFSIQRIVGENGYYGIGVYLDCDILTGLSETERIEAVKKYVKSIGGREFIAYDKSGNSTPIRIAKHSERYKNKKGNSVRVTKDLTSYLKNEVKQEAIVLIDELVKTATHKESTSSKYSHDWLDNDGKNDWDYWRIIIQEKNKTVWEATLNIANTTNGEKILYDIYPIEMVEQAVTSATSTTKKNIPQISPSVKSENKKSVAGTRVEDNPSVSDADEASREASTEKELENAKGYFEKALKEMNSECDKDEVSTDLVKENARLREELENIHLQLDQAEGKGVVNCQLFC